MQAFVDWVLARRHRSLLMTVLLTPLLPAAAALVTVETVHRSATHAAVNAVAALAAAALLAAMLDGQPGALTRVASVCFLFAIGAGLLLRQTRSLSLVFQALVLAAFCAAVLLSFGGLASEWLFGPWLAEVQELLRQSGASEEQLELARAPGVVALLFALLWAQIIGGLLVAYWWLSMAAKEPGFGAQFRRLALGRMLGAAASAVVTIGLVFDVALVQNLSSWALVGFVFQGLAVVHAWAYARRWHSAIIAPVYVLLVMPPLALAVVLALSAVGLIDNWFDLRGRLHAQS